MKFKKIMILAILLVSLLAISTVSAVDLNTTDELISEEIAIDNTNQLELSFDDENDILSMEPIPELQDLVDNAKEGDVIQLTKDYDVYGYVNVNKSVTIDGNNHKINFDTAFRFYVYSPSTIKNIQMVGYGDNDKPWGSIESEAPNLIISNCKFINIKNTGPIVYSSESNLTLDSCEFVDCSSYSYAQAYSSGSNLKVTNTDFINNNNLVNEYKPKLKSGAPLCIFGNDAFVSNCNFINNTGYSSGAIRVGGDRCYITDCTFTNNKELYTATIQMGGVVKTSEYIYNGATLLEVIKTGTTAAAIEWDGNNGVLENPIFENNQGYTDVNFIGENGKIIESSVKLKASDVTKFYGGSEKYTVTLTDKNVAVANANVNVKVKETGETQTIKTNSKGQASMNLNLPVGTYEVVSTYESVSTTSKVTVKPTVIISDKKGEYLNSKVNATFLDTSGKVLTSRQVTFKVGDKTYTATTNSNGVATADVDLDAGTYIVTAINPVNNEQKSANLAIKAKTKITSQKTTVTYNDGSNLVATLTNAATGKAISNINIVFKLNDVKHTVKTDSKGQAKLSTNGLNLGNYNVTISYAGNSKYLSSSKSVNIVVNKADTSISATIDNNELIATLTHGVTGKAISGAKIVANINGKEYSSKTDSNGQASFYVDSDTVPAIVSYAGNAKYNPSSATVNTKANVIISAVYDGDNKEIVATLTNEATGKPLTSTNVQFVLGGATTTVKTNTKGQAKVSTAGLPLRTYSVAISYAGNSKYNSASTKITFDVKTKVIVTDVYAYSDCIVAKLTNGATGKYIANSNMIVEINGVKYDAKSDNKGQLTFNTKGLNLPDAFDLTISYRGNDKYTASSATVAVDLNKANMMITTNYHADKQKMVATLKNSKTGNKVSNANMIIDLNGVKTTYKSNDQGKITLPTADFAPGIYVGTVTYPGNARYNSISAAFKIEI